MYNRLWNRWIVLQHYPGQKTKKPAARKGKTCKDIAGHPATIELMGEMEAVAKDHEELMRAKAEL